VSRDELRAALWPVDTFVDFDNGLNNAVNRLRGALGDNAENPRFVETVGGRGYRFIFPVTSFAPTPEPPPVSLSVPAEPPRRMGRKMAAAGAVGVAVVIAAALMTVAVWRRSPPSSRPALRSIAVLPLANYSGDPSQDYFADGMTEALIAELARIRSLHVIARTSVMQYRGTTKPVSRIAQELAVDAIVEGSVVRSGDRVRVTAQLVEGATDAHLWAETYHRDVRDVLTLQRDVAEAIATAVRAELSGSGNPVPRPPRVVDPQAFDLYLQGRNACTSRQPPGRIRNGIEFLRQAIVRDPKYPEAHAALATCYAMLGTVLTGDPPRPNRLSAAAAAKTALELDDGLASAHALLARIDMQEWNWDRATEGFRRAIDLAPNDAAIRAEHAIYLAAQGRAEEAIAEARLAEALDPLSLLQRTRAGFVLQLARRQNEALRRFQSVLEIDPKFLFARWLMGISYTIRGQQEQAIECFAAAEELSASPSNVAWRAYALAMAGKRVEARRLLDGLHARGRHEYVPPPMIAFVYMALGDLRRTFEWLERGYDDRSNAMMFLGVYEFMDPLRSEPRFVALMRRIQPPPAGLRIAAPASGFGVSPPLPRTLPR
jgi:TolB-like protein/Tfp pilus assembly protein PilF